MTITTRWWWIRHAPVENPEHRLYGQEDLAAVIDDHPAYDRLAAILPREAVWVASHLKRTHQTALAIHARMARANTAASPALKVVPDLAEQFFGAWQGLTPGELRARLGPDFLALWTAPGQARPPGGESFAEVIGRVGGAIEQETRAHAGRDIVAFAHGGSIRAALAIALGLSADRAVSFRIENLSLTRIDHILPGDDPPIGSAWPWRIEGVNHLPEADLPETKRG